MIINKKHLREGSMCRYSMTCKFSLHIIGYAIYKDIIDHVNNDEEVIRV